MGNTCQQTGDAKEKRGFSPAREMLPPHQQEEGGGKGGEGSAVLTPHLKLGLQLQPPPVGHTYVDPLSHQQSQLKGPDLSRDGGC